MLAGAFDERVTTVVSSSSGSSGMCPYRTTSANTFAEGPSDAAVALWTRALEIDPLHRMARVNLALDLHRRGRFDAATVHWDELLRRHPAAPVRLLFRPLSGLLCLFL